MKIFILGSKGFIGSHLVEYYIKKGLHVSGCDLIEKGKENYSYYQISLLSTEFEQIFEREQFDICINAAGSGLVGLSLSRPLSDFEANTVTVIHILEAIRKCKPLCKFIQISSAAVYGNPKVLPVSENEALNPLSPYGWHKLMSEMICKEYTQIYQLNTVITRPFSVYGPGLKKQLLWDVFQKIIKSDQILELWGTGNESRDFIYITDLVRAIDLILINGEFKGEAYNIASGKETTIKEIINLLLNTLKKKTALNFNQQVKKGDPLNWHGDIKRIKEIGFEPEITEEVGIKYLSEWLTDLN